jgi:pimeloyl-ACP methyl ester carboxylesterase
MNETVNIGLKEKIQPATEYDNRSKLLGSIPVKEERMQLVGIQTSILTGGEGPPLLLLHGPGENAFFWMRVLPALVNTYRVIVPDLPGHGGSSINKDTFEADQVFSWLSELLERTCQEPPVIVGHVLGGSIAARFAIRNPEKIHRLILVDSLGLGKFRPSLRFAFGLIRFILKPTKKNFDHFFPQCMYDTDNLQKEMDQQWDLFQNYNLECANNQDQQKAMQVMMKKVGIPSIPPKELHRIGVPTALIWGRYDRANKLAIAEKASARYGWPLYIIENTRDDPKLERPEAFTKVLREILKQNP